MTKTERKYLRSVYHWFDDKHNLNRPLTVNDLAEILKDMRIFKSCLFEIFGLDGDEEYCEQNLKEIMSENQIEILK